MTQPPIPSGLRSGQIADRENAIYHVFVRDLVLTCSIGIHSHEKTTPQRVRLNIDLGVAEPSDPFNDRYETIVDYETVTNSVKALLDRGHVNLVETLAEDIAAVCLQNYRVRVARIRVEKIEIMPEAGSVGVEIERHQRSGVA
ncbi:MAG: dihydroneopterin aldolase [Rhodospirillales bacterium]